MSTCPDKVGRVVAALDGLYLGRVRLPERTQPAFMRGRHIWAIARDEPDVQRVVRYRIETGSAEDWSALPRLRLA